MDEDLELNRFVRLALESKGPLVWRGPRRRWRGPWATASLLAASVTLVAALCLPGREKPPSVDETLRLLTEAEGVEMDGAGTSAELLVAWQEP